jgi:hypothetical protein
MEKFENNRQNVICFFYYLLCFVILSFCITARLKPIRLVNGRGLIFSEYIAERLFFVGVIVDNGGRN